MSFPPDNPTAIPFSRRGSSLMVVMLVMFLVSLAAASLLSLGTQEKNLTFRRVSNIEARHVVESALELAMAELENHFAAVQSVTGNAPNLQLSAAQKDLLLRNARHVQDVRIVSVTNRMLRQRVYVDVEDPTTLLDPHRGTHVNVSEWEILAEVDVSYRGHARTVRASQNFQVRESPFFTHAILYNMDLEFHPGPAMVINGPVHSNARIWAVAQNSLHFLDRVSSTQGIHVGGMMEGQQINWGSGYLHNQDGGRVWFNTNGHRPGGARINTAHDRVFANLYDGSGNARNANSYYDNRSEESGKLFSGLGFSDMSEFLANWFDGYVATGTAEAPVIRPRFIPPYLADDGFGNRLNHGYALIEPLLPPLGPNGGPSPFHKGNGEREKYAFKAGLSFEVRYLPGVAVDSTPEHWRQLWAPGSTPLLRSQYPKAASVFSEKFETFAPGPLHGQSGFQVETGNTTYSVMAGGLAYQNGEVAHTESENKVLVFHQGANRAFLQFPRVESESVYFSYLVRMQANAINNHFQFGLTDGGDFSAIPGIRTELNRDTPGIVVQVGSNTNEAATRNQSGGAGNAVRGQVYLVVGRLGKSSPNGNYDRAEFFLDPSTLEKPESGWLTAAHNTGVAGIDTLFFRANTLNAASGFHISDIRIGRSYREVVGRTTPDMTGATDYWLIPQKVRRGNAHNLDSTDFSSSPVIPLQDEHGEPLLDEFDQPVTQTILSTVHDPVHIEENLFHTVFRARIYEENAQGHPLQNGGLYDKRDLKPQDLLAMDMGAFKNGIVETTDTARFRRELPNGGSETTYNPSNDFNGVVYIQFPVVEQGRPDRIVVARNNFRPVATARVDNQNVVQRNDHTSLSLFVHNARQIPNPSYNASRSPGFTLATNSRLYVQGSYNADGSAATGSSTTGSDEPAGYNALAALAADTITFLSDNFSAENSKRALNNTPLAGFTEVNAALMSGILPTNTSDLDSRYSPRHDRPISGGSHNYHRFLERWENITFRYRGSLVAFYESELARSPQEQSNNSWYGAPRREYGFYDIFGTGAQPPGTPMARTFFKLDFRFD